MNNSWLKTYGQWLGPLALLLIFGAYLLTLARTPVLGDPSEYTVVAHILGIAHPPGYAFFTVVGGLFQRLVPFGAIAWRMHLLAAVTGTAAAAAVYGTVANIAQATGRAHTWPAFAGALFAAFSAAFAANIWQHSIHANPHIMTAAFLVINLFLLTRWWALGAGIGPEAPGQGWLYAFCLSAGLGLTHHPLTVFSFPAYTLFILAVRPHIWREWRVLIRMVLFAVLGLAIWLYFPLRSPMEPALGPSTMNTIDGFFNHVLARGLTESLPFFGLADQGTRTTVFFSLLRLQYGLPTLGLALIGLGWLARGRAGAGRLARPLLLIGLAFLANYVFVINLRQQDIMAYLLGPFYVVALLAGVGLWGLLAAAQARLRLASRQLLLLATALFLLGPALQLARTGGAVSLRNYDQGTAYVDAIASFFGGRGEGAVLLNNWEHQTPYWYRGFVEDSWPDVADVRVEWVSTGTSNPWAEAVFSYLGGGPVYVYDYRPEIVQAGFRLRPRGPFYEVVEPGTTTLPPELSPLAVPAGALTWRGFALPPAPVTAGDFIAIDLAFSAPDGTADYYVPIIQVGDISFPFTTDSHLVTPLWAPGEVIVERFDFALPFDLPTGIYPVTVQLKNLSTDSLAGPSLLLGELTIKENGQTTPPLLANFRQRVGLAAATARLGLERQAAPWPESDAFAVAPGETINVTLSWLSLAPAEESYTVFVHLIDGSNQARVALDYTPLGGAAPTHLWIPKWLPGQRLTDPYRLTVPADLPAGMYWIEVGLYEMTALRRLHLSDENGNLAGDRYILGAVRVE